VIGLVRVRIALLGTAFVVVGAASCGIFDSVEWALIATPALPAFAVGLLARRGIAMQAIAAAASVVAAASVAVVSAGGTIGDLGVAFTAGPQRILSTEWPSPVQPDLVGTVAAGLATLAAASALLATWRRAHLSPLLPVVVGYTLVVALSAPLGYRPLSLAVLCVIGVVFATIRVDGSVRERWLLLRGERRLLGMTVLAGLMAVAISSSTSFASRADPRRDDPAEQTAALLDPIEATMALRALDPPIGLHEVTPTDTAATETLPLRWRTAALDAYDGRRWSPVLTLRPIGTTLGPVIGATVDVDITFLDDDLRLVPLAGSPVSVDAAVETDSDRTVVRLAERPAPGESVGVVSNIGLESSDFGTDPAVMARPVDETVAGLTGLAQSLGADEGGAATLADQLLAIEETMRDDYVLESGVSGGGLQRKLIDRFLRDTQRGNTEQFATAFVLLARSLGANARVATGFIVEESSTDELDLTSSDAAIWPEVELSDGSWVAFDPVPAEESVDPAPPEPEPQVQTPAAPQPPNPPPPESENTSTDDDQPVPEDTDALSTATLWATRVAMVGGVIILPLLVVVGLVLGIKMRRRRRRRRIPDPTVRIQGAWASATDALVDAGLSIPPSFTDDEIARRGDPIAPRAQRELHRLAVLNSAATYGVPNRPDLLAQDAQQCLDAIDAAIAVTKSRWERVRWRLSLRSLRRTTRSPVTA
jgi:hypothetical protein